MHNAYYICPQPRLFDICSVSPVIIYSTPLILLLNSTNTSQLSSEKKQWHIHTKEANIYKNNLASTYLTEDQKKSKAPQMGTLTVLAIENPKK